MAQGWGAELQILSLLELFSLLDTSASHIPDAPSADPLPSVLSPFLAVENSLFPRNILAETKISALLQPGPAVIPPSAGLLDGPPMCPASLPSPHHPISEHFQLLIVSCSPLKELCVLSSPQHSPNPAGRGGSLPCLVRSSPTELVPLQPLHFPSTKPLPPKHLQPFPPSLAEEPSGGGPALPRETQPLCGTSGASQVFPALSAEAVLIQAQGKGGGFVNLPPMVGIHQECDNTSHLLSALAMERQNFTDCCDL